MSHICTDSSTETGLNGTLMERYCPKNVLSTLYNKQNKQYKLSKRKPKNEFEVFDFFKRKKWPAMEAKKFYNHYQGIGWKIGGKVPIEDWTAIAGNWMLKADEIKKTAPLKIVPKTGDHLMTSNQKNYGEPL